MFSREQIQQFKTEGFLIEHSVLSDAAVDSVVDAMGRVYSGEYNDDRRPPALRKPLVPFGTSQSVRWMLNTRVVDRTLWEIATDPRLGECAASLLEARSVSIVEDQLLDKPTESAPVNLHQDYSYWQFSTSPRMLTCWIALCDMTVDMGPVELIPRSHTWGPALRPRALIHGSSEEYLAAVDGLGTLTRGDFVQAIVPRGGGVFFHSLTFHGSRANRSGRWRRAMSLHWAADECRLDRTRLTDYDYPYFFSKLNHGDALENQLIPRVFARSD
jgi:phytanoyl-CoA hydroxylase